MKLVMVRKEQVEMARYHRLTSAEQRPCPFGVQGPGQV